MIVGIARQALALIFSRSSSPSLLRGFSVTQVTLVGSCIGRCALIAALSVEISHADALDYLDIE